MRAMISVGTSCYHGGATSGSIPCASMTSVREQSEGDVHGSGDLLLAWVDVDGAVRGCRPAGHQRDRLDRLLARSLHDLLDGAEPYAEPFHIRIGPVPRILRRLPGRVGPHRSLAGHLPTQAIDVGARSGRGNR